MTDLEWLGFIVAGTLACFFSFALFGAGLIFVLALRFIIRAFKEFFSDYEID